MSDVFYDTANIDMNRSSDTSFRIRPAEADRRHVLFNVSNIKLEFKKNG